MPCPGEDFCCPADAQCGRDSSGAPACLGGGGGTDAPPPTTVSTRPPPETTSTSQVITFRPTTTSGPGGDAGPSQAAQVFTQSFPPAPTPGASVANETVGATDPRISYQGSWGSGTTCQAGSRRTTQGSSSLRFQFIGMFCFLMDSIYLHMKLTCQMHTRNCHLCQLRHRSILRRLPSICGWTTARLSRRLLQIHQHRMQSKLVFMGNEPIIAHR